MKVLKRDKKGREVEIECWGYRRWDGEIMMEMDTSRAEARDGAFNNTQLFERWIPVKIQVRVIGKG